MQIAKWALMATSLPIACFTLTSCSSPEHEPTEKYFLVSSNIRLPYWQTALAGLQHAAAEMKVKSDIAGPDNYDAKAEHSEFQRALAQKPSGILISAADANIMTPDINAAIDQGIPVLTIDSDAPESKRLFFVGTDNYNAGILGGHLVSKLLNGKGNVVIFTIPSQPNLKDRLRGYQDVFTERGGIKVAEVFDMKGDPTVAFDRAKQLLDTKAKVDAFVCLEAIACPEVGEVVNRQNMAGKVTIVAMDTDQRTIDWVQKGVVSATIAQKPWTMGYYGAKLLDDIHHHRPSQLGANWNQNPQSLFPSFVDTGSFIVDKQSVGTFVLANKAATSGQ
ncbi:MAG: substrate-binding domain-containing protein [Acidobacteriaceae bacterium]|nr:substrate-binding domain-containing protein [Acidobacteriaceae bacterium]